MKWEKRAKLRLSELESRSREVRGKVDASRGLIEDLHRERAGLLARIERLQAQSGRHVDADVVKRQVADLTDDLEQVDGAITRANARRDELHREADQINGITGRCRRVAEALGVTAGTTMGVAA